MLADPPVLDSIDFKKTMHGELNKNTSRRGWSTWSGWRAKPVSYYKNKFLHVGFHHIDGRDGNRRALPPPYRGFVSGINRLAHPMRYARRRALGWLASRLTKSNEKVSDGYLLTRLPLPGQAIIAVCERQICIYENFLKYGEKWLIDNEIEPASYIQETAKTEKDPAKHIPYRYDQNVASNLISFALNPMLIAIASRYLGVLPVLGVVRILYSPNSNEDLIDSQLFHIDPEGARQLKVFMAIREVTKDNGPFTFVPKSLSRKMLQSGDGCFRKARVQDADIMQYAPQSEWVVHVGKPGDAVFVDTSSCFHFGSRQSEHPRHLLFVQYHDPFSSIFPVVNPFKKLRTAWQQYPGEAAIFPDYLLARKL